MTAVSVPQDHAPLLARAAAILHAGGLVAFPTETVYGLGADALNPQAVAKIFQAKGRPHFDPLIVHVPDIAVVQALVTAFPETAQRLAAAFWPGPLTLVLPKREHVPDLVTAGLPTVAVRIPRHPIALALLKQVRTPIAAPSANRFSGVSPTTAQHVRDELGDAVDLILDGGPCITGVESTVVSLVDPTGQLAPPRILRLGGTTVEAIRDLLGDVDVEEPSKTREDGGETCGGSGGDTPRLATSGGFRGPGMLERHYAPTTPLRLLSSRNAVLEAAERERAAGQRVGLLLFADPMPVGDFAHVEVLSPAGDLCEAAAHLFAAVRRLDASDAEVILAEQAPARDLGRAINDRLTRASKRE